MGSYSSIENNANYYQNYTESRLSKLLLYPMFIVRYLLQEIFIKSKFSEK